MSQADSDSFLKSLLRENPQSFVNPWGDLQTWRKKKQCKLQGCENTMQKNFNSEKLRKHCTMETSPITLCSACVQMIVLLFANTEDRKMGQQKKKRKNNYYWTSYSYYLGSGFISLKAWIEGALSGKRSHCSHC